MSRPGNYLLGIGEAAPQQEGWTSLMRGICDRIDALGGQSNFNTFRIYKDPRPN